MIDLEKELNLAFKQQNPHYLKKIHLYLNQQYYNLLLNRDYSHSLEPAEWAQFKYIESTWITHEINDCLNRYHCADKVETVEDVKKIVKSHSVYQHPLFDYLEYAATFYDFKNVLKSDAILNLEFFDYLALSLTAVSDAAKREIMTNLWDECGRGRIWDYHTNQFRAILNAFDIDYQRDQIVQQMSWEALSGINLFSYLSQHGFNKMKYFGLMAATEILDPPHYEKLINGLQRVLPPSANIKYYLEHQLVDIQHGSNWIKKVVLPELNRRPHQTIDFWLGFYLRMDFMQRYYDSLYTTLTNKQAA